MKLQKKNKKALFISHKMDKVSYIRLRDFYIKKKGSKKYGKEGQHTTIIPGYIQKFL